MEYFQYPFSNEESIRICADANARVIHFSLAGLHERHENPSVFLVYALDRRCERSELSGYEFRTDRFYVFLEMLRCIFEMFGKSRVEASCCVMDIIFDINGKTPTPHHMDFFAKSREQFLHANLVLTMSDFLGCELEFVVGGLDRFAISLPLGIDAKSFRAEVVGRLSDELGATQRMSHYITFPMSKIDMVMYELCRIDSEMKGTVTEKAELKRRASEIIQDLTRGSYL